MTSEIAVMNRLAVALAADSAVSISAGRRNKVYNSANKLFMLSQAHPVGIMVYSNGSLMGIPWEVLIKTFRLWLGDREFATLEEYGHAFLDHLEKNKKLFTEDLEGSYYLKLLEGEFEELASRVQREVQRAEAATGDQPDWREQRERIVTGVIGKCHTQWSRYPQHSDVPEGTGTAFHGRHSERVAQLVTKYFRTRAWVAGSTDTHLINDLARFFVDKDYIAGASFSGVVIAGFGRDDYFPVLQRFRVGDFYIGKLKKTQVATERITDEKPVHVGVYADSDMADLFLKGISEPALDFITKRMFHGVAKVISAVLEEAGVDAPEDLAGRISDRRDGILRSVVSDIQKFRLKAGEFELALVHIPKDELASVAASLVNLNSLKKRMSMGTESVGGPVDVAVISKGDGFIWIDRKHYFDADKNLHFVRRWLSPTDSQGEE